MVDRVALVLVWLLDQVGGNTFVCPGFSLRVRSVSWKIAGVHGSGMLRTVLSGTPLKPDNLGCSRAILNPYLVLPKGSPFVVTSLLNIYIYIYIWRIGLANPPIETAQTILYEVWSK